MQKKLIASLIATGFAGAAGMAVAGPISVASLGTYAAETIGAAAGAIAVGNVAYTLTSPFALSSTQTIKYTLSAKVTACPAMALAPVVAGVVITPSGPAGAGTNVCSYTVAVGPANAVPANQLINFTAATADKSAGAILAAGTPLNAQVAVYDGTNVLVEQNSANVAVSAQALSANFTASAPGVAGGLFPTVGSKFENAKVSVLAAPVSTAFTASQLTGLTTMIALGAFSVTENAGGPFLDSNGVALVNIAGLTTNKWTLNLGGPFVANAAAGVVQLASDNACTTIIPGTSFTISGISATLAGFDAVAAKLAPVVVNGVNTVSAFVCYTPNAGGKSLVIPTGQFSGAATTSSATAVTAAGMQGETVGNTNLYNLASNGAQMDLRLITTTGTVGWSSVIRVTNTGAVAAPVTATYLNVDGTTGATGTVVASLAPGATTMLSNSQIETSLGISLASTGNPPRLRISAPTNSLRAQVWVQAGGMWFMGTPAQDSDAAGPAGLNSGQFQ